jgi:hypothetical protein
MEPDLEARHGIFQARGQVAHLQHLCPSKHPSLYRSIRCPFLRPDTTSSRLEARSLISSISALHNNMSLQIYKEHVLEARHHIF